MNSLEKHKNFTYVRNEKEKEKKTKANAEKNIITIKTKRVSHQKVIRVIFVLCKRKFI